MPKRKYSGSTGGGKRTKSGGGHRYPFGVRDMSGYAMYADPIGPMHLGQKSIFGKPELKYVDNVGTASSNINDSWSIRNTASGNNIAGTAQNSTAQGRDGNKIIIKSLHMRGHVKMNEITPAMTITEPLTPIKVAVAIVVDRQANGANLTPGEVFGTGAGVTPQFATDFYRYLEYSKRFKVLKYMTFNFSKYDWEFDGSGNVVAPGELKTFDVNLKNLNIQVDYKGNDATIGSIEKNSIFLLACADQNTNGASADIYWLSRTRFIG